MTRARSRWLGAGLVLGSAFTAPLVKLGGLTVTGDRVLGLVALAVAAAYVLGRRLHWTRVHSALALFVAVQAFTTVVNAGRWPPGLKFVGLYVLGFACFCLAAEWARDPEDRHAFVTAWIVMGAAIAVVAAVMTAWANVFHTLVWGVSRGRPIADAAGLPHRVFGGRATFGEPNLMSSFLLVPLALGLWGRPRRWTAAALAALVFGLTFGFTRAAWVATAALGALWVRTARPPWPRPAALAATWVLAFLLLAAAIGASPIGLRVIDPIREGYDRNLAGRVTIARVVVDSWRSRPLLGHGAGSVTGLTIVRPSGKRIEGTWTGNLVLFVLHDSGLLGVGVLGWLAWVVWRRGLTAVRAGASLALPLLAAGGALAFAYQFTHGLWLMYPYVYLGLFTAATEA